MASPQSLAADCTNTRWWRNAREGRPDLPEAFHWTYKVINDLAKGNLCFSLPLGRRPR